MQQHAEHEKTYEEVLERQLFAVRMRERMRGASRDCAVSHFWVEGDMESIRLYIEDFYSRLQGLYGKVSKHQFEYAHGSSPLNIIYDNKEEITGDIALIVVGGFEQYVSSVVARANDVRGKNYAISRLGHDWNQNSGASDLASLLPHTHAVIVTTLDNSSPLYPDAVAAALGSQFASVFEVAKR